MATNFRHSAENIRREVETILQRAGILCRVFARGKDEQSLRKKLERESGKYSRDGKMIQDAIGIRVALYFSEDVEIVAGLLDKEFNIDRASSTVDVPKADQFAVTRHNLIFTVPEQHSGDVTKAIGSLPIDKTFEVQLRSILSEGWHEVEHDLRYKSKKNWESQPDLSRALNGIMATIETAEWSMRKIFDDLAYRNYKCRKWPEMLHNKIRMRVEPHLSAPLCVLFDADLDLAKAIFRIDRVAVMSVLNRARPTLPINLDNLVYIWNYISVRNSKINELTPKFIVDTLDSLYGKLVDVISVEEVEETDA
ncbi:RelA/SpoT family protein [Duganella sp. FT135W]|uniref:RelA/SpoT family protein n=1 Tax=Duganella flavida TaxID=2692175 RepID=A0A6L8KHT3_9BURK|nr:RelA/SpoT domain-containing protein [Duganella flavida]MYM25374.1 RelA/SpoT family protein [Duganella flavida]